MSKNSVMILGYHGMANLGDDVFLSVAVKLVASMGYEHAYVSARSGAVPKELWGVRVEGFESQAYFLTRRLKWLHVLWLTRKVDRVIFCAGSLFSVSPFYLQRLVFTLAKALNNTQISAIGVSAGPFYSKSDEKACAKLLSLFDSIVYRDEPSFTYGKQLLKTSVNQKLSYDIAMLYKINYRGQKEKRNLVTLCLNNVKQLFEQSKVLELPDFISAVIDGVYSSHSKYNFEVTVIATCSDELHGDQKLAELVVFELKKREVDASLHVYEINKPDRTIEVLASSRAVIASRMHAGVFAMLSKVPLLQLSYAPKIEALFKRSGIPTGDLHPTDEVTAEIVDEFLNRACQDELIDVVDLCYDKLRDLSDSVSRDLKELEFNYNR